MPRRTNSACRVVVTGVGLVTPLGPDRETSWQALIAGRRAGRWISFEPGTGDERSGTSESSFIPHPSSRFPSVGAPAANAPHNGRDPVVALALRAAAEAVADAGLDAARLAGSRTGLVLGTSKGGMHTVHRMMQGETRSGTTDTSHVPHPLSLISALPHAASSAVARRFRIGGPVLSPVAACATGLISLNRGFELASSGLCDVVLAGSSDASLTPAVLASLRRLGVLANGPATKVEGRGPEAGAESDAVDGAGPSTLDPGRWCRPFDRQRSGFIVGEGAAVLVLETLQHALERGATPYAEWLAAGSLTDPSGLTGLAPDAAPLSRLIIDVLDRARLASDEVDYVNLHGTATRQNDVYETRALKSVFRSSARRLSTSSLKGALGHLLGAAGSVEAAVTLLALRDGLVPPTVNLEEPDVECDLDYTPQIARRRRVETALKISLGFGGHLAAAVLRRTVPAVPPIR